MQPSVIILMFHRVNETHLGYCPQKFSKYLHYLKDNFPIVIPGEALVEPLNICLTFDDAYFDFYHDVFPFLKKHKIKALLGVPVHFIQDTTSIASSIRLSVPYPQGMQEAHYLDKVPFCTWEEIQEMHESELVIMASHGFHHKNLKDSTTNLTEEIQSSKSVLDKKLNTSIQHFIHPFGRTTPLAQTKLHQHYEYTLRIGNALNKGWLHSNGLLYRVNADPFWLHQQPITKKHIFKLNLNYYFNHLRGK